MPKAYKLNNYMETIKASERAGFSFFRNKKREKKKLKKKMPLFVSSMFSEKDTVAIKIKKQPNKKSFSLKARENPKYKTYK